MAELQTLQQTHASLRTENTRLGAVEAELAPTRAALRDAQEQAARARAETAAATAADSSQLAAVSRERDGLSEQVLTAGLMLCSNAGCLRLCQQGSSRLQR